MDHQLLVANRRYTFDVGHGTHLEDMGVALGNSLLPGEWIELESTSFPHYLLGHDSSIRSYGSEPKKIYLSGFDGTNGYTIVENQTQTFAVGASSAATVGSLSAQLRGTTKGRR